MAGVHNTQGDLMSSAAGIAYHNSSRDEANIAPNSLNLLSISEGSAVMSQRANTGVSIVDTGQSHRLPMMAPGQLQNYHKVMVKPIAPKQSLTLPTGGIQTVGAVTAFGQQQSQVPSASVTQQPHLSPLSSPVLHPPALSSYPIVSHMAPPSHGVPLLSTHNSRMNVGVSTPQNSTTRSNESKRNMHLTPNQTMNNPGSLSANKPRKPCNCKNSQCLKLYCDCFANGEFCRDSCNCQNCKNSIQYEEDRARAVKACLERNPNAFKPKVGHAQMGDERRHIKGCNCKKSGCLKNYCECYEAKIPCSYLCRCVGCQNLPDRPEGKGLMELANAADLRTQQQRAASTHFLDQIESPAYSQTPLDGQKLPYSFVNKDITKATALCLLEEASHATSSGQSPMEVERAVLLEFGRCLEQIINSSETANQSLRESVSGIV